jgi:hypothetical protein
MKSNQGNFSSSAAQTYVVPLSDGSSVSSNSSISSSSSSGAPCRLGRSAPSSSSFRTVTMKTLATVLVISLVVGHAHSFVMGSRPLSKRSFFDIQCKGVYDKGIFAKLDRICDDCYNLYREPQLHSLCR